MGKRGRDHILVTGRTQSYERPGSGGPSSGVFSGDPLAHGASLQSGYRAAITRQGAPDDGLRGYRVTFVSFPDADLAVNSLESRSAGEQPKLLSVKENTDHSGKTVVQATVYIPEAKADYFAKKIDQYVADASRGNGTLSNRPLVESIQEIHGAKIEDLWTDPAEDFPDTDERIWWEVWLGKSGDQAFSDLREAAEAHGLTVGTQSLGFEGRTVASVRATPTQLEQVLCSLDEVAELRRLHEVPTVITDSDPAEQQEWASDLLDRIEGPSEKSPAVCVLDRGIKQTHLLLKPALPKKSMFAADPSWKPEPKGHGHGTEMAGIALYGDLQKALQDRNKYRMNHGLESVKILPDLGHNAPELFGVITAKAIDQLEIQDARRARVFMLSVTATAPSLKAKGVTADTAAVGTGQPTSWSAVVDALAFGRPVQTSDSGQVCIDRDEELTPRLFVISAGNIRDIQAADSFLDRCDAESVEDPAQAWNAITVGAYADKDCMEDAPSGFDGYQPIAPQGELSPASRTSVSFDRKKWPVKPDVVAAGGNWAKSQDGAPVQSPENLATLTTRNYLPGQGVFTTTRDTSAATAQVAYIAAEVMANYPDLEPQTVRALVVHSAEWTKRMREEFCDDNDEFNVTKTEAVNLVRRYGMGVPSLERAIRSADNALTLVQESSLRPYERKEGKSKTTLREMNLHELPWPRQELADLGETDVELRVTLSYFVEPHPSRLGWNERYAYPSFGLRFAMKRPEESPQEFQLRVNKHGRAEGYKSDGKTEEGWVLGANQQKAAGSLHTDIWTGNAADLAAKGQIAVYPTGGWWKHRHSHDQSAKSVPYSLVVSIEAPEVDVDLWTPVAQQVGLVVET